MDGKKMKVLRAIVTVLVLTLLCACGNTPDAAGPDNGAGAKINESAEPAGDKEPDESPETPKDGEAAGTVEEEEIQGDKEEPAKADKTRTREEYVEEYDSSADVLYAYRDAQDKKADGYTYYDIDSDGRDELFITYEGRIADIYGYYGNKMRCAFSAMDGYTATVYPGGMLKTEYSGDDGDFEESWYVYYSSLGDYLRALDNSNGEYYEVCGWDLEGDALKEIEDSYKNYGYYPEWIGEWFGEMTRSQYESCLPKSKSVKLPKSEKLSDVIVVDPKTAAGIKGKEMSLDAAEQKKLNIFMSNFSEAGLLKYDKDDLDMTDILHWTFIWTKLNKDKNIERRDVAGKGLCEILSLDNVNAVTEKYLGITISEEDAMALPPDDTYGLFFDNGNMCMPAADGESYTNLTVVDKAEDLGARRFKFTFTVYSQDLDEYFDGKGKDEYYRLSGEEASKKSKLEIMWSGYAIASFDGSSYKLEYLEQK